MCEAAGGEALALVCNVGDEASVEAMAQQVMDHWGRIDILMTNAAVQPAGFISTIKPKSWELEFNINVHGPFRCIRAVLPAMQAQKSGNVINISSVAARGGSHYGATKRAVEAMTIGLARELKDAGIAVNAMKPVGGIETPGLLFGRPQGAGADGPRAAARAPPRGRRRKPTRPARARTCRSRIPTWRPPCCWRMQTPDELHRPGLQRRPADRDPGLRRRQDPLPRREPAQLGRGDGGLRRGEGGRARETEWGSLTRQRSSHVCIPNPPPDRSRSPSP